MLSDNEFSKSVELLQYARKNGIKIRLLNDRLMVKAPPHISADSFLLSDIREHKEMIFRFLSLSGSTNQPDTLRDSDLHNITTEKLNAYASVTPVQLYWLDPGIDTVYKNLSRAHGSIVSILKLEGTINNAVLEQSVLYLLTRHDSLRSVFRPEGTTYLTRLLPTRLELFYQTYDYSASFSGSVDMQAIIEFKDHDFDTETGPLFLMRFVNISAGVQILSFKIHHVIADTASMDILRRDLLLVYQSFIAGRQPVLPVLNGQYSDHLKRQNLLAHAGARADKAFWQSLYKDLPRRLHIPGLPYPPADLSLRLLQQAVFEIHARAADGLRRLAGKYKTTLFIVLQTAFKYFLGKETGIYDILIGTYVSGRDNAVYDHQIGCYAKTMLVRSVFTPFQPFAEMVEVVAKANSDMHAHQAYTLRQLLESFQPATHNTGSAFWDINLQFSNTAGSDFFNEPSALSGNGILFKSSVLERTPEEAAVMPVLLQLNFSLIEKRLYLKTEYDASVFSAATVSSFIKRFQACIDGIICENDPAYFQQRE